MQLTSEQREQLNAAKAKNERRVNMRFTAEQKREWQDAVALELAGKDENIAFYRKLKNASEQPGFVGDIRRAVMNSSRSASEIAGAIDITPELLADFQVGEAELSAEILDRLIASLGLRLMQEIPR